MSTKYATFKVLRVYTKIPTCTIFSQNNISLVLIQPKFFGKFNNKTILLDSNNSAASKCLNFSLKYHYLTILDFAKGVVWTIFES